MTDLPQPPRFEDRPPAKVNLTLEVVGRRPDGYHELRSIFLRIGLTDRLTVAAGGADGSDTLTVSGVSGAPTRDNLVTRALNAVRARAEIPLPVLDIVLEKGIPSAAGLGGGSSDCASAIRLAQVCWGVRLSTQEESALGLELGSDVPFFLIGAPAALVEGRGERVTPLADASTAGLLLVTPPVTLSTARVFARYDDLDPQPGGPGTMGVDVHRLIDSAEGFRDANDLWAAAASLEPSLPALRAELEAQTSRPWMMSGSGPTLFALYPSAVEATEAGTGLVAARLPSLANALINAVDLVGPDPAWRFP